MNMLKLLNLHGVFYGCETWSVAMHVKLRMEVFENGELSKKFCPKLEKIKRRLQELLYATALRSSPLTNITLVVKSTLMRGGVAQ